MEKGQFAFVQRQTVKKLHSDSIQHILCMFMVLQVYEILR